jgi:hypothetical protein
VTEMTVVVTVVVAVVGLGASQETIGCCRAGTHVSAEPHNTGVNPGVGAATDA